MKISEAKEAYSAYLNELRSKRSALQKVIKDQENGVQGSHNFDRLEISRQIEKIDAQYEETQSVMEFINERENLIMEAESSKQQGEAMAKSMEDMIKCMKIFHRIAKGDKVPPYDEKKLMEFDAKLYMVAKSMALTAVQEKRKKHKSLWENEKPEEETPSPQEIAGDSEISVPAPESVSVSLEG